MSIEKAYTFNVTPGHVGPYPEAEIEFAMSCENRKGAGRPLDIFAEETLFLPAGRYRVRLEITPLVDSDKRSTPK